VQFWEKLEEGNKCRQRVFDGPKARGTGYGEWTTKKNGDKGQALDQGNRVRDLLANRGMKEKIGVDGRRKNKNNIKCWN